MSLYLWILGRITLKLNVNSESMDKMEVISSRICWWACVNIVKEFLDQYTIMHCLMMGIHSEKCVVRQFRHRANVIECTYTNLDSIAYYTPRLYGIAYCS
jgi:hypothetical protein